MPGAVVELPLARITRRARGLRFRLRREPRSRLPTPGGAAGVSPCVAGACSPVGALVRQCPDRLGAVVRVVGFDAEAELAALVERLAAARVSCGLSQRGLGARLGMAEIVVGKWELCADRPSVGVLIRWAFELGYELAVVGAGGAVRTALVVPRGMEPLEQFDYRRIALTLKDARCELRWVQDEVGARLGVSEWTVRMWECARRRPRVLHLLAWADVVGCRVRLRSRRGTGK